MANPATRIVFDLDGTLVQTRIASWQVFQEVQAEFGLGVDSPEEYFAFFEGNFFGSLRALAPDERTADAFVSRFFARLEDDYHPEIIPGMATVARTLASRATLAVLSSNATSVIRRVLVDHGLQFCFSHVYGGDVEPDKAAGLRRFLIDSAQGVGRRCAAPYDEGGPDAAATATDTVLVTDTVGDVEAAVAAGVRVVGVSWGMHTAESLRDAGAEFVAVWPQELVAYLLPDGDAAEDGACVVGGSGGRTASPSSGTTPVSAADVRRARRTGAAAAAGSPAMRLAACGCTREPRGTAVQREPSLTAGGPAAASALFGASNTAASDEVRTAMRALVDGRARS